MYVIFNREEIQEKMNIKRTALDTAVEQLKECNLIKEKKQGKNMPNIIYLGKTIGIEFCRFFKKAIPPIFRFSFRYLTSCN